MWNEYIGLGVLRVLAPQEFENGEEVVDHVHGWLGRAVIYLSRVDNRFSYVRSDALIGAGIGNLVGMFSGATTALVQEVLEVPILVCMIISALGLGAQTETVLAGAISGRVVIAICMTQPTILERILVASVIGAIFGAAWQVFGGAYDRHRLRELPRV